MLTKMLHMVNIIPAKHQRHSHSQSLKKKKKNATKTNNSINEKCVLLCGGRGGAQLVKWNQIRWFFSCDQDEESVDYYGTMRRRNQRLEVSGGMAALCWWLLVKHCSLEGRRSVILELSGRLKMCRGAVIRMTEDSQYEFREASTEKLHMSRSCSYSMLTQGLIQLILYIAVDSSL